MSAERVLRVRRAPAFSCESSHSRTGPHGTLKAKGRGRIRWRVIDGKSFWANLKKEASIIAIVTESRVTSDRNAAAGSKSRILSDRLCAINGNREMICSLGVITFNFNY